MNCFDSLAAWKRVRGVIGTPCSRSAIPYPFASSTSPSRTIPTAAPGESGRSHSAKIASTSASIPESTWPAAGDAVNAVTAASDRTTIERIRVTKASSPRSGRV